MARSTQEAVDQIIDAMRWLGLDYDEGPFYQMQRIERYREVIAQMLAAGTAYHCYCSPDELDAMREAQRARGEKPRYDGRWRPEPGKTLPRGAARRAAGGALSQSAGRRGQLERHGQGPDQRSATANSTT